MRLVRPVTFRPMFEKHAGNACQGVMLHVTNSQLFRPLETYLTLLCLARTQAPAEFAFRTTPYEFENATPAFDLLTGSPKARNAIQDGARPEDVIALVCPVDPSWQETVREAEARLERAL